MLGNHDPNIEDQRFTNFLRHSQICLLHNKVIRILGLNIFGRTDSRSNYRAPLKELLKQTDPSRPLILLDHDPQGIPEAVRFGADLVLCGHTHKGQFFPVTLFTKWANADTISMGMKLWQNPRHYLLRGRILPASGQDRDQQ